MKECTDCLNRLSEDWAGINSCRSNEVTLESGDGIDLDCCGRVVVIIYGLGIVGRRNLKKIKQDFQIQFIIDNSKKYNSYEGLAVKTLEEAETEIRSRKIVIMGTASAYRSMAATLEKKGLQEFKDYCGIEQFLVEWYWKYKKEVCLLQVDVAVTLKCTLCCRDCNMFIPYHDGKIFTFEEMKWNFDLFFGHVDYLSSCILLGGEPLLNPELGRLIEYLGISYGNKIGKIGIITNGTLKPSDELLRIIKKYYVEINISDYTKEVPYKECFDKVVECFERAGVVVQIKKDLTWCSFGFPVNSFKYENPEEHMHRCSTLCHGINDGRYYYCHMAWSAGRLGLFEEKESDYIDLQTLKDESKLLRHTLGEIKYGLKFCELCGGAGSDNCEYVSAGIQIKKEGCIKHVLQLQNGK